MIDQSSGPRARRFLLPSLVAVLLLGVLATWLFFSAPTWGPHKTLRIAFDNAVDLQPGAAVTLAGRRVGAVSRVQTPLAPAERPPDHPDYEALITVSVDAGAEIYRKVAATVRAFRPDGPLVVDLTGGDPTSGAAESDALLVGARALDGRSAGPGQPASGTTEAGTAGELRQLDPTLQEAQRLIATLRDAVENLVELTNQNSAFAGVIRNLDGVVGNLRTVTDRGGPIDETLRSVQAEVATAREITDRFNRDRSLDEILGNFKAATDRLEKISTTADRSLATALPQINAILADVKQLTDTLKRQPWRILYPSTVKYPEGAPSPAPAPPRRRDGRG